VGGIGFQNTRDPWGDRTAKWGIIKGHDPLSWTIVLHYSSKILFMYCNYFISFFLLLYCKLRLIQDRRLLCYVTMVKGVTICVTTQLRILGHFVTILKMIVLVFLDRNTK